MFRWLKLHREVTLLRHSFPHTLYVVLCFLVMCKSTERAGGSFGVHTSFCSSREQNKRPVVWTACSDLFLHARPCLTLFQQQVKKGNAVLVFVSHGTFLRRPLPCGTHPQLGMPTFPTSARVWYRGVTTYFSQIFSVCSARARPRSRVSSSLDCFCWDAQGLTV